MQKAVCYDYEHMHTCLYMFACTHALGKEGIGATGELLAQSAGGREGWIKEKEGAAG